MKDTKELSDDYKNELKQIVESYGLECQIGG